MRLSTVAALASFATLISAVPLEKRVLVIETVTSNVIETVNVYTTVVMKAGGHRFHKHLAHKPSVTTTPAAVVVPLPVSTPSSPPAQSPSPTPTPIVSPPAPVSTPPAPVSSPPAPVSSPPAAVYTPPTPVSTPPAPVSSPPAPVYTPPATVSSPPAPVYTSPAPTPVIPKPVNNSPESGGTCGESGGSCSGDLTFYQAGLGSCGLTNDGSVDKVFALAHGMMEEQHAANPNLNPLCGRMATVYLDGKSVVAKLVDTCAACEGQSIDLSNAAFDQIGVEGHGRYHDVSWHFN